MSLEFPCIKSTPILFLSSLSIDKLNCISLFINKFLLAIIRMAAVLAIIGMAAVQIVWILGECCKDVVRISLTRKINGSEGSDSLEQTGHCFIVYPRTGIQTISPACFVKFVYACLSHYIKSKNWLHCNSPGLSFVGIAVCWISVS